MKWKFWEKEDIVKEDGFVKEFVGWDIFTEILIQKYVDAEFDIKIGNIAYNGIVVSLDMDVFDSLKPKATLFRRNFANAIKSKERIELNERIVLDARLFFDELIDWLDVKS